MPYTFSLIPATDPEDLSTYLVGYGNPDFLGMGTVELAASMAATHEDALPRRGDGTAKVGHGLRLVVRRCKVLEQLVAAQLVAAASSPVWPAGPAMPDQSGKPGLTQECPEPTFAIFHLAPSRLYGNSPVLD